MHAGPISDLNRISPESSSMQSSLGLFKTNLGNEFEAGSNLEAGCGKQRQHVNGASYNSEKSKRNQKSGI